MVWALSTACAHPQTNGMVERFNGRISEVVNQPRFASRAELEATLQSYSKTYNQPIPQRALNHLSPVQALRDALHNPSRLVLARPRAVCGVAFIANITRYWPKNVPHPIPTRAAHTRVELCRASLMEKVEHSLSICLMSEMLTLVTSGTLRP